MGLPDPQLPALGKDSGGSQWIPVLTPAVFLRTFHHFCLRRGSWKQRKETSLGWTQGGSAGQGTGAGGLVLMSSMGSFVGFIPFPLPSRGSGWDVGVDGMSLVCLTQARAATAPARCWRYPCAPLWYP